MDPWDPTLFHPAPTKPLNAVEEIEEKLRRLQIRQNIRPLRRPCMCCDCVKQFNIYTPDHSMMKNGECVFCWGCKKKWHDLLGHNIDPVEWFFPGV